MTLNTNIYIDGFNLYYGSLKGTNFKWLDLSAMCHRLLPGRSINKIRYFTALIQPQDHDRQAPERQRRYLAAIETIPNLIVQYGRFVSRPQRWPLYPLSCSSRNSPPHMARILRTEEKRSDVNLATLLMLDCVDDDFDEAVVVTNDSDLVLPVELAVKRFGKVGGVINPQRRGTASRELSSAATWTFREINRSVLAASQFPDVVWHPRGAISKPASW